MGDRPEVPVRDDEPEPQEQERGHRPAGTDGAPRPPDGPETTEQPARPADVAVQAGHRAAGADGAPSPPDVPPAQVEPAGPGGDRPAPPHVRQTLDHVDAHGVAPPDHGLPQWQGRNRPYANDGRDDGETLPATTGAGDPIAYTEYDVRPFQPGQDRGGERLVVGSDDSAWYTDDHYRTFQRIR